MAETYSLEAVLSARDEGFTAGMKAAGRAANSLGSKLKSGIGFGAFMAIGNKAVSAVGTGITSLVGDMNSAGKAWKTFQGNMEMNGHSKKEIKATKKELQDFAEKTIYSASDMASTFGQLDAVGTKNTTSLVKGFGGLAAAAENPTQAMKTLSTQATQMAAKPKVAWQDFKLMMEQTPAGVSAVAKEMGMSTKDLVKSVQDGKVKTEDFFEAVSKVGTNDSFTKMAMQYKSVDEALDGLSETAANKLGPVFEVASGTAVSCIGKIVDSVSKIDGNSLAKKLASFGSKVGKYWSVLQTDTVKVGKAFGSAISSIGSSISKMNGSFGSAKSVSGFKTIVDGITKSLEKFAGFCENNSDTIAKVIPNLLKMAFAFKMFKVVKSFIGPVASFTKSIASLAGKGIAALAAKLFGIAAGEKAVGSASMENAQYTMQAAKSFMMLGVGVGMIAAGFGIMAGASIALAEAGPLAIGVMVAMVGALVGLGIGMTKALGSMKGSPKKFTSIAMAMLALGGAVVLISAGFWILSDAATKLAKAGPSAIAAMAGMVVAVGTLLLVAKSVAPSLTAGAVGFIAFGAAILIASVGMMIMAQASVALASGGGLAIACMVGMVAALAGLMVLAAALGPALTVGAVGMVAFGVAIALVGVGVLLACAGLALLSTALPQIATYGLQASSAIMALGASLVVFGAGALVAGAGIIVFGASLVVASVGLVLVGAAAIVAAAGITVLGVALVILGAGLTVVSGAILSLTPFVQQLGDTISQVADSIGNGFSKVLDSVAKVIESVGTSAKNAGEGFLSVANGIKTIAGLSLGAIAKSLGAVSIGLSKISKYGSGVSQAASGLKGIVSAVNAAGAGFSSLGSKAASSMSKIKSSMNGVANSAKSAGSKIGTSFTNSMKSGLSKASGIATKASKSVATKLRSGHSAARSAGSYISQGFASGMSSCLGQIESAASRMVAAADKAIRAKAKIHSPSRMTKTLGRYIAIGLGLGIRSGIKEVTSASKNLASKALTTMRNATKTRKYEDAASSAVDKYKSSMESKVSSTTKSLNKIVDKGIKKLQKKNPKLKKVYTQVGKILKSDMSKTIKEQGKSAISAADKALTALGKKYQEKYDKIISDRDKYLSKLSDYGSLYSTDSYGFIALKDFTAQTKQVEALGKNMESLKKSLPYNLMSDIQDMDTASALAYTNELLKKGDSWLKKYGKDYTKFIDTSKSVSNKYYQPYITQLDKDYSKAVTSELKKLQNQMNSIGKNATAGFIKGLTSKSSKKALKKAAKDLASILTKSVKGKLKIHSPSRVLASLGKYAGQGLINGIASMKSGIADIMNQIIEIPTNPNLSFAGDVGGELSSAYDYYSNAQYTIVVPVELEGKEIAKVTAPYTEAELNKRQKREDRKRGRT
ncbi:MAG: tape measure protein [Anaerostipes sp.]|nr:tape measure protein [Anaerostipes sp.]